MYKRQADGAAHPVNLFYSNTVDLKDNTNLGLGDFTDSYTMAGYVLSSDVTFFGLDEEQTKAVLESVSYTHLDVYKRQTPHKA